MNTHLPNSIRIKHNAVPNRIRFSIPLLKHHATLAEMLRNSLLRDEKATGIYHAEANIVTGTLLIKYHPAFHTEEQVISTLHEHVQKLCNGEMVPYEKHKNPKLGKMQPHAFFTRELVVSVCGNVLAGLVLAVLAT
ncbi:MAG: HMA2 domain-containing protein [Methylococcaceae bacterium]